MQEKIQKISPIKQRILQYAKYTTLSMRDFYLKCGISRGTLESNTGITEDTITKIIANFENISPLWLLTGDGDMLKDINGNINVNKDIASGPCQQCVLRDKVIAQQEKMIVQQEKMIDMLEDKIEDLKNDRPAAQNENYKQTA